MLQRFSRPSRPWRMAAAVLILSMFATSPSIGVAGAGPSVSTSSLPVGQAGSWYNTTLVASGGTAPYTWSLTSGTLPAGLSLNASTGAVTGTPAGPVSNASLTFTVTDSSSPALAGSATLALTVKPANLKVGTGWIPGGQVGVAYSRTLSAVGGTLPYTWTVSAGVLPAGLTLNASSGVLSGIPTAIASKTTITFMVTDAGSPAQTSSVSLSFSVAPAPLSISSTPLPNGQLGVAYSATVTATGGTAPYTWALAGGSTLPPGLSLNPATGAVTGTPTALGRVYPQFKVTDSASPAQSSTTTLSFNILPAGLIITTASLPNGQVGVAYSATLTASGGTTPYVWSLASGTLPAGLSLNAASGAITGTPTAVVSGAALSFKVSDSENPVQTATAALTLTTVASNVATLVTTTSTLPNGQVGVAYSATLTATGGTTPYTWSLTSGTLPAGLSLNPATGAITGTPTAAVSAAALTFKVSDSGSPAQSASVSLTLTTTAATLTITTTSLPSGQAGAVYSAALAASGGTTPYTWSLTSGTLPAGLSLNPATGAITGTPTAAVTAAALTFKVSDSGSPAQSASVSLTLTTTAATLTITTTSLPSGQVGAVYSATLAASGGTAPYTWSLTSGTLPAGLSLNTATGAITGTPTAAVSAASLTFKVSDSSTPMQNASVSVTLTIASNTLTITTTSLPNGQVSVAYSANLTASGGTTPYSWSLVSGTLPAGLALNTGTGAITGTPTTAVSSAALTFRVTDSGSPAQSATVALTLTTTQSTVIITTTSLPNGQAGSWYNTTLAASGGTAPYTWSLSGGTFPVGLSLNASTGAITGKPASPVSGASLTFTATDSSNPAQTGTATLAITVAPATLKLATGWIPDGQVGIAYFRALLAVGGTTPYAWSVSAGALPAGLTLNPSTGVLSGTPTAIVSKNTVTFMVSDAGNPVQTSTATLTFSVAPAPLSISSTSLPNGQLGVAYSATVTATGGTAPYSWALAGASTLPAGLTLNPATGAVTGTPTALGRVYPQFKVTDSASPAQSSTTTLSFNIGPAGLSIATNSLPNAQVGVAYSATLTASGGATPYVWSLTSGTLPAGLSLNTATGAITGTPTTAISATPLTLGGTDSSSACR